MTAFPGFRQRAFGLPVAVFLSLCALFVTFALAQDPDVKATDSLVARLDQIEATLSRDGLSDSVYSDLRSELIQISGEARTLQEKLQPELQETKARLDTLKPSGTEEETKVDKESELVKKRRAELETTVSELDGQIKLATSALVRAQQLSNRITLERQQNFTRRLLERSNSILDPLLWISGLTGLATTWQVINTLLSDWTSFLASHVADQAWQLIVMLTFVLLLIFGPLRYLLFSGLSRLARLDNPSPMQRSFYASWAVAIYTLFPVAILWAINLILSSAGLLPDRIQSLFNHIQFVVFAVSLSYGLIRVLLAPTRDNYRLLNVETGAARKLFGIALSLLAVFAFEILFDEVDEILFVPLETTILVSGLTTILIVLFVSFGLRTLVSADPHHPHALNAQNEPLQGGFSLPSFIRFLQPLAWIACAVIFAAPILGYVSLGTFLAEQFGRLFVILGLLGILSAFADNLLLDHLEAIDSRKRHISKTLGITSNAVSQFGVLLNGMVRIVLYIATALLIFTPWGVESADFLTSLKNAVFSISIGDLTISPINILGALGVFVVAVALMKSIERWIEHRWMPATGLDTGLKNSIQTSLGYLGIIIAAMLSFSYMGLDLSNIALVAGALSVGIGFGLQSIVNNFVSGLILLVERPIKTGDWVVVGTDQGYVKKISVRATKIETFDRATVVVPNSELISNRVMNWMHNGSMGRIIVPIGVSYDSDPEQVREILLKAAQDSEYVASYPSPVVYFMEFGASSLDFELRCFIQDINSSLSAKSALRFAIFKALKGANIEIPFPQQDIHVRSISKSKEAQEIIEDKLEASRKPAKSGHALLEEEEPEDIPIGQETSSDTSGDADHADG